MVAQLGKDRLMEVDPVMAGEDFGRYRLHDPSIQSLIFWVGGVPWSQWERYQGGGASLPSLHSPQWAPDYAAVIQTASDALTTLAVDLFRHPIP